MLPKYIDIHSHLFFKDYELDLPDVLARMADENVWTITVGTEYRTSQAAVAFSIEREGFYSTVGLHPNHAKNEDFNVGMYSSLINDKVVAIGECGIDYFRIENDTTATKKRQVELFEKHIDLALHHDLPLMVHARPTKGTMDAYHDVIAIIESRQRVVGEKLRGNIHFFVGDIAVAKKFYEFGFTTSFTGVLTFASDYDSVVSYAPLNMIMAETDAPFVSPIPFRGRRNEPAYVTHVVEAIARIRGYELEKVSSAIVGNTLRVFNRITA